MINNSLHLNIQQDCKTSCNVNYLENLKNSNILITGGTGFIGKWLCEMIIYLNENNNFNINLILLSRNIENFKLEFPHFAEKKYIKYIESDIKNIFELPQNINYIVHAAGSPDNVEHSTNPIKTIETFVKGTYTLLESAFRIPNLKKIVHLSSHLVYGDINSEKIDENNFGKLNPYNLNSVYSESKRISETYCAIFKNQYRLPIVIARPFAFIGPYQLLNKPWAINNFIRDAILEKDIRILGNENTERTYLYASDMAFWLLTILTNGNVGEVYNLGSENKITLKELSLKIAKKFKTNINIINKVSNVNNTITSKSVPDISKLKTQFNLSQQINLDEAIEKTIEWNIINLKKKT